MVRLLSTMSWKIPHCLVCGLEPHKIKIKCPVTDCVVNVEKSRKIWLSQNLVGHLILILCDSKLQGCPLLESIKTFHRHEETQDKRHKTDILCGI